MGEGDQDKYHNRLGMCGQAIHLLYMVSNVIGVLFSFPLWLGGDHELLTSFSYFQEGCGGPMVT